MDHCCKLPSVKNTVEDTAGQKGYDAGKTGVAANLQASVWCRGGPLEGLPHADTVQPRTATLPIGNVGLSAEMV